MKKKYRILKTFHGNQTGNGPTEKFVENTEDFLTDHLAETVLKEGWVELVQADPTNEQKVVIEADKIVHGPAEREMKVEEPEETKPAKPAAKKGKKAA